MGDMEKSQMGDTRKSRGDTGRFGGSTGRSGVDTGRSMELGGKEIFYGEDFLSRKMSSDQSLRVSHYFQFIKTFGC
jgi:hypothetical protein